MRITKSVQKLEAYVPGEQPKSPNVVKLNTNENAYPPSPACAEVLKGFDLDRLRRYPDPNFSALRAAMAQRLVRAICEKCKIIKRKGRVMVICENPKHKQKQG